MPTRSRLPLALFALLSLAGSGLVGACSDQGEGEPCSPYSTDCQSNLECILVAGDNVGYRCCPIPPAEPTANNICLPNNPGVNGGNPPPSDAASTTTSEDATTSDSASDTGLASDAPVEASVEGDAPTSDAGEAGGEAGTDAADSATE
jgi:hypothetical protein